MASTFRNLSRHKKREGREVECVIGLDLNLRVQVGKNLEEVLERV